MKTRRPYYIISGVLIFILVACFLGIKAVSGIHAPSFVLIRGYTTEFYKSILSVVMAVVVIALLGIRVKLKSNRTKGFCIRLGVETGIMILALIAVSFHFMKNMDHYHREPYLISPDGKHTLYQDGGDSDIFGNRSGYMHYAQPVSEYGYARVFYCYKENYTPQIEWYEDGFLVKYSCPEAEKMQDGNCVAPESDLSSPFLWERREDGIFFYYAKTPSH